MPRSEIMPIVLVIFCYFLFSLTRGDEMIFFTCVCAFTRYRKRRCTRDVVKYYVMFIFPRTRKILRRKSGSANQLRYRFIRFLFLSRCRKIVKGPTYTVHAHTHRNVIKTSKWIIIKLFTGTRRRMRNKYLKNSEEFNILLFITSRTTSITILRLRVVKIAVIVRVRAGRNNNDCLLEWKTWVAWYFFIALRTKRITKILLSRDAISSRLSFQLGRIVTVTYRYRCWKLFCGRGKITNAAQYVIVIPTVR